MTLRIACIHQGYELYGSDRSFAESVAALRQAYPSAEIEVVLPREGPIRGLLEGSASRIVIEPLWVLRRRDLPRLIATAPVVLPRAVLRAARRFRRCDLVYINTSVIVDHVLAARFFPGKALQHIHEIPEGATRTLLRRLVLWGRARLIFNSRATREAFEPPPGLPSDVIYNGVAGPADWAPTDYDGKRRLRVLMLGRINRIKGQEILLAALAALPAEIRGRIETRIVGSAFEDPGLEIALRESVTSAGLDSHVSVEPFLDDPTPLYRWADVVAVPSRRPESLGRVAIEAMAFGRPPLASAIGGLREVVEDGITGRLLPPGDAGALAQAFAEIVDKPDILAPMARAGRERFTALFSEQAVARAIAAVADDMLRQSPAGLR
ncbi:glycosyltransferase family 4 protein [Bosea robiniae]|uniref:Glycosyltransferase involved in cell wall bisynthesis n=1 Tax=Bosea robiniae TaxID=1036780 RepID=A0ABY0NPC5_9HYPH|nr:glycosyltransferase family 4 protein [Bosea robiniae]SDF88591.1 Glycosyltransferase involved in cell wall bisynthesis [Bosea robiniae]